MGVRGRERVRYGLENIELQQDVIELFLMKLLHFEYDRSECPLMRGARDVHFEVVIAIARELKRVNGPDKII